VTVEISHLKNKCKIYLFYILVIRPDNGYLILAEAGNHNFSWI